MTFKGAMFCNCGGGIKSKIDFIRLQVAKHLPTLAFIIKAEINNFDINMGRIQGYELIIPESISHRKARIVCYIKNDVAFKELKIPPDLDMIGIDILGLRIVGVYKRFKLPPGMKGKSFFNSVITTLKGLTKTDKQIIIGGDFNTDLNKKTANLNDLEQWAMESGLQQKVKETTRERVVNLNGGGHTIERSIIDHIYTNVEGTLIIESSISDHYTLLFNSSSPCLEPTRKKFKIRDWRDYDKDLVELGVLFKLHQISKTPSELKPKVFTKKYLMKLHHSKSLE